jgi:acyl-CoA dehydrogenase
MAGENDAMNERADAVYQVYFGQEHAFLRKAIRDLVKKEILPNINAWEEAGEFPRSLYKMAGDLGFLGIGYPEQMGGTPGDVFLTIAMNEELMRSGSGGLVASLGSHSIALPPIVKHGTPEQIDRFVRPVIEGKRIAALGVTEPGGGSDVASLETRAVRDGDHYIVNGSKTFITSGVRADQLTCAVRTGENGAHGISFLVIEKDTPGYSVSDKLKKTGWWASDTAEIFFSDCRVPVTNLIGGENKGFYIIMENFQMEIGRASCRERVS